MLDAAIASTLENGNASDLDAAALLPPKYVDFKEQIRTEMFSIKQKMNELRQLHGKVCMGTRRACCTIPECVKVYSCLLSQGHDLYVAAHDLPQFLCAPCQY